MAWKWPPDVCASFASLSAPVPFLRSPSLSGRMTHFTPHIALVHKWFLSTTLNFILTHTTPYKIMFSFYTHSTRAHANTHSQHICVPNTHITHLAGITSPKASHFLRYLHEFMCADRQYSIEMTAQSYAIRRAWKNWTIDIILPPKATFTFKITIAPYANDHTVTENLPKNAHRPWNVELTQIYLFSTLFTPLPSTS